MSLKIGVLMGGNSSERNVSIKTGHAVLNACEDLGYYATKLSFKKNYKKLLASLKKQDIIFNSLHGGIGENGEIQYWMDKNKIKYTGSGPESSKLCMDKAASKELAKIMGVQTPEWELINDPLVIPGLEFPYVIKPNDQGSTFGISVIYSEKEIREAIREALKYGKSLIAEKYVEGRELTLPIIGEKALPIVEIIPSHDFYDYECKYSEGLSKYECPANLDKELALEIRINTELLFQELGCNTYARADFILSSEGVPYFLEMNTLPGMTATSLVPKSAYASGIPFNQLIRNIVELSL